MKKIIATSKIQKSASFYINIPKKIAEAINLEVKETALFEVLDQNTIKITIIED